MTGEDDGRAVLELESGPASTATLTSKRGEVLTVLPKPPGMSGEQ